VDTPSLVDTPSPESLISVSLRADLTRHRRALIAIVAALFAVAAFLEWGPIGLGNGPLQMGMNGASFGGISSRLPVAILTPISNSSGSAIVIHDVQLLGNGNYPAPHVVATEAMSYTSCGDLFPVRTTAAGFVLTDGCGGRPLGPLYGRAIGNENSAIVFAAFKVRPPRPGACWLMTRIVTHYHVGIRHYVASNPYVLAACAGPTARAQSIADAAAGIVNP
jgi:hypothetical protein